MGLASKAVNAATTVAAPEAEPAVAAATVRPKKPKPAARPPATATPTPPPPASPGGGVPSALTDMRGAPGWYQQAASPDPVALGNTGGGFLLGVLLWAAGLAYLRGGAGGVKQLLKAKFLNQVTA